MLGVRHQELPRGCAEKVVNTILGTIVDALAVGRRVELRGFGVFRVKQKRARLGRNPRTGAQVKIEPKRALNFRTGWEMRKRMNSESAVYPPGNPDEI